MRGYGATVARLTPDQKVGSSNLSALIVVVLGLAPWWHCLLPALVHVCSQGCGCSKLMRLADRCAIQNKTVKSKNKGPDHTWPVINRLRSCSFFMLSFE